MQCDIFILDDLLFVWHLSLLEKLDLIMLHSLLLIRHFYTKRSILASSVQSLCFKLFSFAQHMQLNVILIGFLYMFYNFLSPFCFEHIEFLLMLI